MPLAVAFKPRGRPRRDVPPEVKALADETYRSKKAKEAIVGPGEEEEARELISLLRSYADSTGRTLRLQPREVARGGIPEGGCVIYFAMVDVRKRT